MPQDDTVLITGANGEIGHGLIHHLCSGGASRIVATDIQALDPGLQADCQTFLQGDITDPELISRLGREYAFTTIYHLASILSTKGERDPELAHRINVDGTLQPPSDGDGAIPRPRDARSSSSTRRRSLRTASPIWRPRSVRGASCARTSGVSRPRCTGSTS